MLPQDKTLTHCLDPESQYFPLGQSHIPFWDVVGQLQLVAAVLHIKPADCTQSATEIQYVEPYGMGVSHIVLLNQLLVGAKIKFYIKTKYFFILTTKKFNPK